MVKLPTRVLSSVLILSVLACVVLCGCAMSKADPLRMRTASHNLVIKKDNTLCIEKTPVDFANIRNELVSRLIFERAFITLHVHQEANQAFFQKVMDKLTQEGFRNVDPVVYSD